MTEAEAKTKWCPWARVAFFIRGDLPAEMPPVSLIATGSNRIVIDDPKIDADMAKAIAATGGTRCIGSACMAWNRTRNDGDHGYCRLCAVS